MTEHTLVKFGSSDSCIYFWTVSRDRKSPSRFFVTRDDLKRLEREHYIVSSDLSSFARLCYQPDLGTLEIRVSWLSELSNGFLSGYRESLILDWTKFWNFVQDSEAGRAERTSMLTLDINSLATLDFSNDGAKATLHRVLATPDLRRKLTRALRNDFQWSGKQTIKFYADWDPHSFYFEEIRPNGSKGICGGLILHGNGKSAKYSIHT